MAEITYTDIDLGLSSVSPISAGSTTSSGILISSTEPLQPGDIVRLEVRNNGTLIDVFEGAADVYTEPTTEGYKVSLYDTIVTELGIYTGQFEITGYILAKQPDLKVVETSRDGTEIKVNSALPELRALGENPTPLYLYHQNLGREFPLAFWVRDEFGDGNLVVKNIPTPIDAKFPRQIRKDDAVDIWDLRINPFAFNVTLNLPGVLTDEEFNNIGGPDFYIDVNERVGKGTKRLDRETILGAVPDVKNRIINTLFSGSLTDNAAELGIDYKKFENHIHFSSAEQRLRNFAYKMELIENYNSQSAAISSDLAGLAGSGATGSYEFTNNIQTLTRQRDEIIGSFDKFEEYLYYESGSAYTDTFDTYISLTWPKSDSTKPYTNVSVSSSAATAWRNSIFDEASIYDDNNQNILRNLIPLHIKMDPQNDGYTLFVDMVAQHFDILYNYVDHIGRIHEHDEDLNIGVSKDLLYDVLQSFGWEAVSGWDKEELWSYFLGTDASGSYHTTSSAEFPGSVFPGGATQNFVVSESSPVRDLDLEPYSRIFNNLPFIYKTKGTERGVRTFLSTYGIPSTIVQVQEYGGPDKLNSVSGSHTREFEVANNELQFDESLVRVGWGDINVDGAGNAYTGNDIYTPRTVEFRFRTNQKFNQGLVGKGNSWAVWMEHSSSAWYSNYGRLHLSMTPDSGTSWYSASTEYLPLYDNDYWSVSVKQPHRIQQDGTQIDNQGTEFKLTVLKAPHHADGRITHTATSSLNTDSLPAATTQSLIDAWAQELTSAIEVGRVDLSAFTGVVAAATRSFSGSIQEYRHWRTELPTHVLEGHAKAPVSYYGANFSESFDNLVFRLPFGTDNNTFDIAGSDIVVSSSHPSQIDMYEGTRSSLQGLAQGFVGDPWNTIEDVYFVHMPNSIGMRSLGHKIRIEDNTASELAHDKSYERSSFDNNPIDLNLVSVAVSPQDNIDLDIAYQFGGVEIDDIVGDPRDRYISEYSLLRGMRDEYFKKFNKSSNLYAYLRLVKLLNSAIFKQVEQLLPARASKIVGVIVKPSLLERPKVATQASISIEQPIYSASVDVYGDISFAESADPDSMEYTSRFGGTSLYSSLVDEIVTYDVFGYDLRDGSRYSYDESTLSYQTASTTFRFASPSVAPVGTVSFVGSRVDYIFTASADMGTNTHNKIYIANNTLTTNTKIAQALFDAINNNPNDLQLSASAGGAPGTIIVYTTRENSPTSANILVHTGSSEAGELVSLVVDQGFTNGTGSFVGGVEYVDTTTTELGVMNFASESVLSDDLFKTELYFSSAVSKSLGKPYSSSFEPARVNPLDINSYYRGTRQVSPDFNIDSEDTVDGGPVASFGFVPDGVESSTEITPGTGTGTA